jgi:hypothetical protein
MSSADVNASMADRLPGDSPEVQICFLFFIYVLFFWLRSLHGL